MSMGVSLIVPFRDEEMNLEACVRSLLVQSQPPAELIFVDNGSRDGSRQIVRDYAPQFRIPVKIVGEQLAGIPFARNRGIRESSGERIAFLDADCIAPGDYIELFVKGFEQDVQAVTGRYVLSGHNQRKALFRRQAWERHFGWLGDARLFHSLEDQVGTLVLGCSAFVRKAISSFGGYDTRFLYADDIALSYIFYRKGFKALFNPDIKVRHRIKIDEISLMKKDIRYGSDQALINMHLRKLQVRFYPEHLRSLAQDGWRSMARGDT